MENQNSQSIGNQNKKNTPIVQNKSLGNTS